MNSDDIQILIDSLKSNTEQLIFDIAQDTEKQVIHKSTLEIFAEISQLQKVIKSPSFKTCLDMDTTRLTLDIEQSPQHVEINKVARRLKKWANNQHQINAQLLNRYLLLSHETDDPITEISFKKAFDNDEIFNKNFPQMKIISPKNHGKIFDERFGIINIWQPIQMYVDEYEVNVFKENNTDDDA